MKNTAAVGSWRNRYRLIRSIGQQNIGVGDRCAENFGEQFISSSSTASLLSIPKSKIMQVDASPLSKIGVIQGRANEPNKLSSFFFEDSGEVLKSGLTKVLE